MKKEKYPAVIVYEPVFNYLIGAIQLIHLSTKVYKREWGETDKFVINRVREIAEDALKEFEYRLKKGHIVEGEYYRF